MQHDEDAILRDKIRGLLSAGLQTQIAPIPEDNHQFEGLLRELHGLGKDKLTEKLVISGFVDRPYGEEKQSCFDCMYYLVHRKWCALPQLSLPVEPDWWCRLWRV
jgi:hypothetical protein